MRSRAGVIFDIICILLSYFLDVASPILATMHPSDTLYHISYSVMGQKTQKYWFSLTCDVWTDVRTDVRTDRPSYRDARTHLKIAIFGLFK